ncbi:hypothetical protein TSAR_007301 [Trichomalopsis sarcophagae]|uniref:Tyr recombinase domain-containing protein n=1 Tax=Trichomalopsis sarcophagae TaxID=543379 RepID=A0A232FK08_9HYME|nr:hypothetical protein TSAR_007301 [Trichomalopsis sarcophagae]
MNSVEADLEGALSVLNNNLRIAIDELAPMNTVALIFGIAGALRRIEFTNIVVKDVTKLDDEESLLVRIPKTKNYVPRSFTITGALFDYCWRYMQLRPVCCATERFFLRYTNGKCVAQPVGVNKFAAMPKEIATYLKLQDVDKYTGHSFRMTSATLLVDAGADLLTLQRYGGWKSSTVAIGYIAESLNNKKMICGQISSGLHLNTHRMSSNKDVTPRATLTRMPLSPKVHQAASSINQVPQVTPRLISKSRKSQEVTSSSPAVENEIENVHHDELNVPVIEKLNVPVIEKQETSANQESNEQPKSIPQSTIKVSYDKPISSQPVRQDTLRFPVFYDPDLGLYTPGSNNLSTPNKTFIFNDCQVTINYVDHQKVKSAIHKLVQTDDICQM